MVGLGSGQVQCWDFVTHVIKSLQEQWLILIQLIYYNFSNIAYEFTFFSPTQFNILLFSNADNEFSLFSLSLHRSPIYLCFSSTQPNLQLFFFDTHNLLLIFFPTGQSITYYYYQHTQTITIFFNAPSLLLFLISTNNLSLTSKQSFLNYLLNAFCVTTEGDRSIITSLTQPMYLYSLQDARTWERCIECVATK